MAHGDDSASPSHHGRMAKPTDVPEWALDDDFATGPAPVIGTPTKVDPTTLKNQGFIPGTAAAAQIMNWLLNRNGRWAKWLDGLFEDDGSAAQVKRGLLQLVHAVQADIVAGDVSGAYARLRGEPGIAHTVASAVEDAVYASLTSWASDERARLTLRGAIREIRGRDVAGANAPVTIPHGLNVGASFTPPAGYLPGEPAFYTEAGSYTWTPPAGVRAVLFELVGAGGGAGPGDGGGIGGGGGEYTVNFFKNFSGTSVSVTVGAGGVTSSTSHTNGGDSKVEFGATTISAEGGKYNGLPGDSGFSGADRKFRGQHGGGGSSVSYALGIRCVGGASGAGWAGHGGSADVWNGGFNPIADGEDGAVKITPLF